MKKKDQEKVVGVLGGGGRESVLIHTLLQDPSIAHIFSFLPNAGSVDHERVTCVTADQVNAHHSAELAAYCKELGIGLMIAGSETFHAAGFNEAFQREGIAAFGPSAAAAQIETNKAWARVFMDHLNLPQPEFHIFTDPVSALIAAKKDPRLRVVKATGLAAGKGVTVCDTLEQVEAALIACMVDKKFGQAGEVVVLEERLGWHDPAAQEISAMFFTDSHHLYPLPLAQDYKREYDADLGENTGGMGAHTARELLTPSARQFVETNIAQKILDGLQISGTPFVGVLYVGLMQVPSDTRQNEHGLYIIEVNARPGDPETAVQLPALAHDNLFDFLLACALGDASHSTPPRDTNNHFATVVLCAPQYPRGSSVGKEIVGLPAQLPPDVQIFHAGTTLQGGKVVTNGGRILEITARGDSVVTAVNKANAVAETIFFEQDLPKRRTDIGKKYR